MLQSAYKVSPLERVPSGETYKGIVKVENETVPLFERVTVNDSDDDFLMRSSTVSSMIDEYSSQVSSEVMESTTRLMPKDLKVPEPFLCPMTNELMDRPAMIESGVTYEHQVIERYFEQMTRQMEAEQKELDEDEFDQASYFKCPVTKKRVDPGTIIENGRLKMAIDDYRKKNPWAYQFNARRSLRKTKIQL